MRLAYSLGSILTIEQLLQCAARLDKYQPDTVWVPETWGMENFAMLSRISNIITKSKIGSSIINIYSRSPALIAMGAATIDSISNRRLVLGLGTSSLPIVEEFHGYKFQSPLLRMKEYVVIIRQVLTGKKIDFNGKIFSLKNFSLLIKPPRDTIPIYLAAVNKKMVKLAWQIGDGVIFFLRPIDELKNTVKQMQSKKKIDVACQIITCMSDDEDKAITRAKKTIAFYVSVGKIYRKFLAENGFRQEAEDIYQEYKKTGLSLNHNFVTASMLDKLTIYGTPEQCIKKLELFYQAGVNLPIIQFNPVGDLTRSFDLLTTTMSKMEK